jgi:hypothetical protein
VHPGSAGIPLHVGTCRQAGAYVGRYGRSESGAATGPVIRNTIFGQFLISVIQIGSIRMLADEHDYEGVPYADLVFEDIDWSEVYEEGR